MAMHSQLPACRSPACHLVISGPVRYGATPRKSLSVRSDTSHVVHPGRPLALPAQVSSGWRQQRREAWLQPAASWRKAAVAQRCVSGTNCSRLSRISVKASAEANGCPVMPASKASGSGRIPIGETVETLLRVVSVVLPAAACLLMLPQAAPSWLKAVCAAAASVLGFLGTKLAESLYWRQQYRGLDLPHTVREGKHPVLSHLPKIFGGESFLAECRAKYGEIFSLSLPLLSRHPVPVIYGGAEVRQILSEENTTVVSSWPAGVVKLLGDTTLLALQGKEHQRLRQVMGEVLNDTMINRYGLPITLAMADKSIAKWCNQDEVAMLDEARDFTMQISISFILGFDVDDATFKLLRQDFDAYSLGLFAPDLGLPFGLYHEATKARARMCAIFSRTFKEWLPKYRAGTAQKGALYSCVQAAENEGLTVDVDYICDQLIMLLFAGTETTATSLCSACQLLNSRPDVLRKIADEVEGLESHDIANPFKAPYTRAVANEILRVKPPVLNVFRETLKGIELHGRTIPAGWTVLLSIGSSSTSSVSEPEDFEPERWLDLKKLPSSYIPFGHGGRICPGKTLALSELHAVLGVLAKYDFTVINLDDIPKEGPPANMRVAFSPRDAESAGAATPPVLDATA